MSKIKCELCGAETHAIQVHLKKEHPELTLEAYQERFPDAPIYSQVAIDAIAKQQQTKAAMAGVGNSVTAEVTSLRTADRQESIAGVFELGNAPAALNARGEAINITVFGRNEHEDMIPEVDNNYVWNIDLLKTGLMGLEMNIPTYFWGHAGTGKTTIWEQIAARTNRPMIRIQHTASMVEEDLTGRWVVKDGQTEFEYGPLALAMMHGWLYLADEYDFAFPQILSVYQAVLEGKPLMIKEAPEGGRLIKPHKNFRIVATGNTNGSGDETGLYQGTNIQNAANFSRFGITEQVPYMPEKQEILLVRQQAGLMDVDAEALVQWAGEIRKAHEGAKIGMTVGPRELINAGLLGAAKQSIRRGVRLAITNRASTVDREIANELAQRFLHS